MAARSLGFVMARGSLRLGAVAPRRFMGAVSTGGVDMNLGRTPERTAELEKLAEEHNGFLFGELVRSLLSQAPGLGRGPAPDGRRHSVAHAAVSPARALPDHPRLDACALCAAAQRGREQAMGGLGVFVRAPDDVGLYSLRACLLLPVRERHAHLPATRVCRYCCAPLVTLTELPA